jgi:RimJ/RimL family protein N-acetyltransferase
MLRCRCGIPRQFIKPTYQVSDELTDLLSLSFYHSCNQTTHRTVQKPAAMLDFNFYITTPRLAITYFNPRKESHIAFTLELYKDYIVVDENANPKPTIPNRAAAIEMMQVRANQIETTGYGRYCVSVLAPPSDSDEDIASRVQNATPVGLVGLNLRGPNASPLPDIGFNFLPSARGKGYAGEAVKGLLEYYDREKGVTELLGYCDDDNEASIKVLRRAGFCLLGPSDVAELKSPGQVNKGEQQPQSLLVWTRGLKKDPKEYGIH